MNTTTQMRMAVPDGKLFSVPLDSFSGLLALANLLVGGAMCVLRPELVLVWVAVMAFVPGVTLGLRLLPGFATLDQAALGQIQRSIIAAGGLVFVPVLLRLVEAVGVVEFAGASRSIGVTIGLGVLLAGGYLVRGMLASLSARAGSAVATRVLGFASRGTMAGGMAYALLWLVAPLDVANLWASCALGAALLLVVARSFVSLHLGSRRSVSRR